MKSTLKPCKICGREMLKGLMNTCSPKCEEKKKAAKDKEKKKIAREKKKVSISVLTIKCDKILSEYTRKRDSLKTTGSLEKCVCITCGELKEYSQMDAGHFVTRASRSTRWEEKNVNSQCKACNGWGSGRQYEHGVAIDAKYGEGTADRLIRLGHEPEKVTRELLDDIIAKYTEKLSKICI